MMRALLILCLAGSAGHADAIADLRRDLPAGWTLEHARGQLAIARQEPVRVAGRYWTPHSGNAYAAEDTSGTELSLRLEFRLEPAWSAARLAAAKRTNARRELALRDLRAKHAIDRRDAGQRDRLARYAHDARALQPIQLPRCTLGAYSLFAGDETQLSGVIDPTIAARELYAVYELVKRHCR